MTEQEKWQLYEEFTADDMRKLKQIVYSQVKRYCGDSTLHLDDYYSVANMTLWRVIETYDEEKCDNFYAFLVDCIKRKIKTELTKINNKMAVSTSTKTISFDMENEDGLNLTELIDSQKKVDDCIDERNLSENAYAYVKQFDGVALKVVEMIMDGFSNNDIQRILKLTRRDFDDVMTKLKSYKNSAILKKKDKKATTKTTDNTQMEDTDMMGEHYFNRSKTEAPTVRDIKERIEDSDLLLDYVMQRDENQWTCEGKSNQVSDMLQMNPLPSLVFAQRKEANGTFATFVIDGKQRITNVLSFINDGWRISKKVRRPEIRYEEVVGYEEDGTPIRDWKSCDIRGMKFSELPARLQKMFYGYQFDSRVYIDCSNEDISYHIARYNDGKAMNSNQKSILRVGYEYASKIRKISDMPFFSDEFKTNEIQKGIPEKICVEAIMASNYLDDWKKKNEDNAEYIANNASDEDFDDLEETVDRLSDVVDSVTRKFFNAKDGFIFLTVFNKYKELNLDNADEFFNEFLTEFSNNMLDVKVDDVSWNDYASMRNTKDKKIVSKKIEHVYSLLEEYINRNNKTVEATPVAEEVEEEEDDDFMPHYAPTNLYHYLDDDNEDADDKEEIDGEKEKRTVNNHYWGDDGNEEDSDSLLDECDEESPELPRLPKEGFKEKPIWEAAFGE